jgi:hypothetical protein
VTTIPGLPSGSGSQGSVWRGGLGAPPGSLGNNGDFYIDVANPNRYYGPKGGGTWGNGLDLVNPAASSTGVISGGQMAIDEEQAFSFTVTKMVGVVTNYINALEPVVQLVNVPAQTVTLTGDEITRTVSWWVVNANGVISSLPAPPTDAQRRATIQLGVTAYLPTDIGGVLLAANAQPVYLVQPMNQMYDLMMALGPFVVIGGTVGPNGANLSFNLATGTTFNAGAGYKFDVNSPHLVPIAAESPASFYYNTQLPGSESSRTTALDPTVYDLEGVVTTVGASATASTIQRVYLFSTDTAGVQLGVQYGQTVYATLAAAKATLTTDPFIVSPDFTDANGILLAYVIIAKACVSLEDAATCSIVMACKFD